MTDGWIVPLSGLTSAPSTDDPGVASWIAWLRGSRASPSPMPESAKAKPIPATSGLTSDESLWNPSPQLSFWKMCLVRCRISSMSSCPTYRDWATPLRRDSLRRLKSARRTDGSGFSFWPTATAQDDQKSVEAHQAMKRRMGQRDGTGANRTAITSLTVKAKQWMTPKRATGAYQYSSGDHNKVVLNLEGQVKNFLPGRQAPRSGIGGSPSSPAGPTLPPLWQTPKGVGGGNVSRGHKRKDELLLEGQAKNWQTPRTGTHGIPGADATHGGQPKGLRLNPLFVAWLQGVPSGWADPAESISSERMAIWSYQFRRLLQSFILRNNL